MVVLGDTAVEFTLLIGASAACAVDSLTLLLPPSRAGSGEPLTVLAQAPEAGDIVAAWVSEPPGPPRRWAHAVLDDATLTAPSAPCDVASGWVATPDSVERLHRLTLRQPVAGLGAGTPIRIGRRGRLALYVDGRGEWMLGWRRCQGGACGIVQPVAGPLRTPAGEGFRVSATGHGLEVLVRVPDSDVALRAFVPRDDALR